VIPGSRIEAALRGASRRGAPAVAAFLTGGYPRREGFGALLRAVAEESDVVEVGVPFGAPMADGVTIQRSSRAALEAGVTLPWLMEVIRETRPAAPVLLMTYLNPLLAPGLAGLARRAAESGVDGFIVPDLPLEESAPLRGALESRGLALVQLVTPVTPGERLAALCRASRGFVYAVTVTGTTGTPAEPRRIAGYLDRVRALSSLPVLAGFGVRGASEASSLAAHCDGVVVGSALIELLERGESPRSFLRSLRRRAASASGSRP